MDFIEMIKIMPAAIIGLTVHEFSHAYMAFRLGDNTAKGQGRLTLNPLKHIDWMGFFLIVIAGFGWAKPVSFSPDNLKHKHRDEILISIAGPFSNLIPLPPLDGSHLYLTFLKETDPRLMMNLYKYGTLALLVLIIAENSLNINILHLSEMINTISSFFIGLMGFH